MEFRYRYLDAEAAISLDARPGGWVARVGDRRYEVQAEWLADGSLALVIDGQRLIAQVAMRRASASSAVHVAIAGRAAQVYDLVKSAPSARRRGGAGGGAGGLVAPMPGQVRQTLVAEGDTVAEGQPLILLEAMKMEIRVSAPAAGRVVKLLVAPGQAVELGQELIQIDPLAAQP